MHALKRQLTFLLAAAAIALATAIGPATAAGANEFIPGVTDSSTGVLRELERRSHDRFVPGVTDSGTGVLRELERRRLERQEAPTGTAADSGFGIGPAAIAAGAALAAAAVAGSLVLVPGARGGRITT
jgi:hypothetical protein